MMNKKTNIIINEKEIKKLNASCIYLKHNIYLSNDPMNKILNLEK